MNLVDVKLLWRDWRGGQLNLIMSALVLAVMVVTAVSLLADRVERGLNEQISSFLAADLALQGGVVVDQRYIDKALDLSLQIAKVAQFRSIVFAHDKNHLAAVKVVDQAYPLRGLMELSGQEDLSKVEKTTHGPQPGQAWVEPRLLTLLDINLGDTLEVGYSKLKITRLITHEPDRGMGFSVLGARVMMNDQDLIESKLVRPGSRITYKLLLAGSEQQITKFSDWYKQDAAAKNGVDGIGHLRLRTPQNSEQSLSDALQRGRTFLLMSGTIGVLLAGLAMALESHRYASRLTDQVALMKAWGQPASMIRRSHILRLIIITIVATLVGMALGWVAHYLLLEVAKGLLDTQLPLPGWHPWLVAGVTGFVCVLGFALPALWHLPSIAPLKVLRRDLPDDLVSQGKRLFFGVAALFVLALWYSSSIVIAALFLAALFALFGVCAIVALQILKLVQQYGSWQGSYIRLGLVNLWRRRAQTLVQLLGFSTTLMLLLVVVGLRTSLIAEWQAQIPDNAPSHFLFNVSSQELELVKKLLEEEQVEATRWYAMVRGRLISLNGEPLTRDRLNQSESLNREVNFTQSVELPVDNKVVTGNWWSDDTEPQVQRKMVGNQFSMEQKVATELDVSVGDEIGFSIGGLKLSATLTSIRTVDWQSMNPNFYIVFNPGVLDKFSLNWVTSARAVQSESIHNETDLFRQAAPFVNKIVKQFPTTVVIEISEVIARIRDVITRVTQGLEMILLLVLACGALVLFAAIGVSFDERLRENAVLRTLGGSRMIVIGALTTEFAVLGAIAGFIAVLGAEIILYFIQTEVFNLPASEHPQLWLLGLLGGIVLITLLGLIRSREIITVPPLQSLRQIT